MGAVDKNFAGLGTIIQVHIHLFMCGGGELFVCECMNSLSIYIYVYVFDVYLYLYKYLYACMNNMIYIYKYDKYI